MTNSLKNHFLSRFLTSLTNGPRSLSHSKASTHSTFREKSHTSAYTPKQGHSLLRIQRGFALPAKSSPKEQPEKVDARLMACVRCPAGCVVFFASVEIAVCTPCAQGFLRSQGLGYHYLRYASHIVKVFCAQVSKRLTYCSHRLKNIS